MHRISSRSPHRFRRTPPLPEAFPESVASRGRQKEEDEKKERRSSRPPLPEAFPESAAARGKQKEKNEKEKDRRSSRSPSPSPNRIIPLRRQASLHSAKAASSSHAQTSNIPVRENPFANVKQNFEREKLCIKAAEMVWDDLSQVLIWPMNDIDQSDEAMCERVTDLLGPDLQGEEVVLGDPFIAENFHGMSIIEDTRLCGVLVATEKGNVAKVRVADLANLKPQTEKYPVGYGEFDVASKQVSGSHVVIVKRGQQAILAGKVKLRFFVRVLLGTEDRLAKIAAEEAWDFRRSVFEMGKLRWHEYITSRPP